MSVKGFLFFSKQCIPSTSFFSIVIETSSLFERSLHSEEREERKFFLPSSLRSRDRKRERGGLILQREQIVIFSPLYTTPSELLVFLFFFFLSRSRLIGHDKDRLIYGSRSAGVIVYVTPFLYGGKKASNYRLGKPGVLYREERETPPLVQSLLLSFPSLHVSRVCMALWCESSHPFTDISGRERRMSKKS